MNEFDVWWWCECGVWLVFYCWGVKRGLGSGGVDVEEWFGGFWFGWWW